MNFDVHFCLMMLKILILKLKLSLNVNCTCIAVCIKCSQRARTKASFYVEFSFMFLFLFFNKLHCTYVLKIPLYQIVPFTGYYVHLIASLNEATSLTIKKSIIKTPEGRALLRAVLAFTLSHKSHKNN